MDYVWCFWIADCHKLHRFLQNFLFLRNNSSERLQWRMNASILSLSAACVKAIQALTAYVSFAKMTALNTLCRHSRFRPCARNVFNAKYWLSTVAKYSVHVLINGESISDRHSEDIYTVNTFDMISTAGNWVECFRRLFTNTISSDFMRFNFRLLTPDHCSMLWISSCL